MNVGESLPDHQPQPAEERLIRLLEVVLDPLERVDVRFLQHVGRRHAAGEPVVEPQLHHAPQLVAMLVEQLRERGLVAGSQASDERGNLGIGFSGHSRHPTSFASILNEIPARVTTDRFRQIARLVVAG